MQDRQLIDGHYKITGHYFQSNFESNTKQNQIPYWRCSDISEWFCMLIDSSLQYEALI